MKKVVIFGSTGSVGKNVIDVTKRFPDKYKVIAISSNNNIEDLAFQAGEINPEVVAVGNENLHGNLKTLITGNSNVVSGEKALEELAAWDEADLIFMAISGTAALKPLVSALKAGKQVALASKEPIVSAGSILRGIMDEYGSSIIPVDSEHSAVMQCLSSRTGKDVRTLYITGSGGSLWKKELSEFDDLTVEEVLNHPKWSMGRKITVDSATFMNKGLEVIEARWLFGIEPDRIKAVVHQEALIHAMVEFLDGTISACLFCPDMRFPILKALSFPDVLENDFPRVDFQKVNKFSFYEPDNKRFPALPLAYRSLEEGGTMPAVLNAANEVSVNLFLDGKIRFTNIIDIVQKVMDCHKLVKDPELDDVIDAEVWARKEVLKFC